MNNVDFDRTHDKFPRGVNGRNCKGIIQGHVDAASGFNTRLSIYARTSPEIYAHRSNRGAISDTTP